MAAAARMTAAGLRCTWGTVSVVTLASSPSAARRARTPLSAVHLDLLRNNRAFQCQAWRKTTRGRGPSRWGHLGPSAGASLATRATVDETSSPPGTALDLDPSSFEGSRLLAKLSMLVYWNAGQPGFWDPTYDASKLDLATPLGFEALIASDPARLRDDVFRACTPAEPPLWLDPDPGLGPVVPTLATAAQAAEAARGMASKPAPVSRVAVLRLSVPDWIVVVFRGTTPSPLRGLLREGQINGMAGQEVWSESPDALIGARVHRGYAGAYRTVLADVEGAVTAWAREEATRGTRRRPPRVVVVGHSLGGALATLCSARLAHDPEVLALAGEQPAAVDCVTFGQPRCGDSVFRAGLDESTPKLNYTRVVRGGDLFARVPTSGFWLPGSNAGALEVDYAHAGSLVWIQPDGAETVVSRKGAPPPPGFNSDISMVNPAVWARDHAGYAHFFPDELERTWPSVEALR